jgi:hypothetical protein
MLLVKYNLHLNINYGKSNINWVEMVIRNRAYNGEFYKTRTFKDQYASTVSY